MKKKILYLFLLIIFIWQPLSYAETSEILEEQKESFGISDFVKEAKEYSGKVLKM